jgi:hypothetical protein
MTYSLFLQLKPPVERTRILRYFAARKHFKIADDDTVVYENEDTFVGFFVKLSTGRSFLLRKTVGEVEFEVNYLRPSFFGMEAEIEAAAFVAEFNPRIEDPQIDGMGKGPYSREGFLAGWNFGNLFSIRTMCAQNPDLRIASLPADRLRTIWRWNYRRAERAKSLGSRHFVPKISFTVVDGRLATVAIWPGMQASLPRVDYVAVGRMISNKTQFGLAPWSDIVELLRHERFDITQDPIEVAYFIKPPSIENWVSNFPMADLATLENIPNHQVIDAEILAAAREAIQADGGNNDA